MLGSWDRMRPMPVLFQYSPHKLLLNNRRGIFRVWRSCGPPYKFLACTLRPEYDPPGWLTRQEVFMSKALTVQYKGREISLAIEKVDRTRLYGYVETEVLDDSGRRCQVV